jgi:hypothetical protein
LSTKQAEQSKIIGQKMAATAIPQKQRRYSDVLTVHKIQSTDDPYLWHMRPHSVAILPGNFRVFFMDLRFKSRAQANQLRAFIDRILSANNVDPCRGQFNLMDQKDDLAAADTILYITHRKDQVVGLLMAEQEKVDHWSINLLCATKLKCNPHFGTMLHLIFLWFVIDSQTIGRVNIVSLTAIRDELIPYYATFGYELQTDHTTMILLLDNSTIAMLELKTIAESKHLNKLKEENID